MDDATGVSRWFPADVDVAARHIQFLPLDEASLERAPFLDNRLDVDWSEGRLVPFGVASAEAASSTGKHQRPPSWL